MPLFTEKKQQKSTPKTPQKPQHKPTSNRPKTTRKRSTTATAKFILFRLQRQKNGYAQRQV